MDEQDILEHIQIITETLKPFDKQGTIEKKDGKLPEYYEGYNMLVEEYEDILIHAERGKFPKRLFSMRSPNMSENEYDYLKSNYKNVTYPVFIDFVNSISRPFSDGNWSMTFREERDIYEANDMTFEKYITEEFDLKEYIKSIILPVKLKDANGCVTIKPERYETTDIQDEKGNVISVLRDDVLLSPKPFYYSVKQIVNPDFEELVIVETGEKSLVKIGDKKQKYIGRVYEAYTKTAIYRVQQVGEYNDYTFEIQVIYQHDLGYVPAFRMQGLPKLVENKVYYESPFLAAVDYLDLVTANKNNLEVSKQNVMYPYRVMVGDYCDFQDGDGNACRDGYIIRLTEKGGQHKEVCPSCSGSGLKERPSRFGTTLVNADKSTLDKEMIRPSEAIHFAQPGSEALQFVKDDLKDDLKNAKAILHLRDRDETVSNGEDSTATGRSISRDDQQSFVQPISDQAFNLMYNIAWTIGKMRYDEDFPEFDLRKAVSFDFRTKDDYLEEIRKAQEIGIPMLIRTSVIDYLKYVYHAEVEYSTILNIVENADRLFSISSESILAGLTKGSVELWEKILHDSSFYFVEEIIRDDEGYIDRELAEQITILQEKAKAKASEIQATANNNENSFVTALLNGNTPTS